MQTESPLLLQILIKKLDRTQHIRFEYSLEQPKEIPSIADLLSFLKFPPHETESSAVRTEQKGDKCRFCSIGSHALYRCIRFIQLSEADKLKHVQMKILYFNCLKGDHSFKNCASPSCKKCGKKHNTLLHLESSTKSSPAPKINATVNSSPTPQVQQHARSSTPEDVYHAVVTAANISLPRKDYVLLETARVRIIAENRNSAEFWIPVRK